MVEIFHFIGLNNYLREKEERKKRLCLTPEDSSLSLVSRLKDFSRQNVKLSWDVATIRSLCMTLVDLGYNSLINETSFEQMIVCLLTARLLFSS